MRLKVKLSTSGPTEINHFKMALTISSLCRQTRSLHLQNRIISQSILSLRNLTTKKMGLPRVFFDMVADNQPVGRVIMEVSTL